MGRTHRRRKKRVTTSAAYQPPIDYHKIQSLVRWLRRNGYGRRPHRSPTAKLRPAVFEGTGRGLQCRTSGGVRTGDLLVSIPIELLITTKTVLTASDVPIDPKHSELDAIGLLTAFVLWERRKGSSSRWSPYFESLPDGFDELPYFWSNLDTICRSIPVSLGAQLNAARLVYNKSMRSVFNELDLCDTSADNRQLFRWCFGAVNTRCVYLDTNDCPHTCAMAPFLDLLNHSCDAKVDVVVNDTNDCYEIYSLSEYKPYEEVFINYGNHCNRDLFVNYGFCCRFNDSLANNSIPISFKRVADVLSTDPRATNRLNVMLKSGIVDESTTYWIQYEMIDWRLDTVLRLLALNVWSSDIWVLKHKVYSGSIELMGCGEQEVYGKYKRKLIESLLSEYNMKAIDLFDNICLKQLLSDECTILSHHLCDLN